MMHQKNFCMRRTLWVYLIILAFFLAGAGTGASAQKKPSTVAELALYRGADRQQILEEGARKEGKLVFYTTGTQAKYIVQAFQKKYPYIKVEIWRASTNKLIPRIIEENKGGKNIVDVIGPTQAGEIVLQEAGLLQPYYSPELVNIEEDAIVKAADGSAYSAGHFQSGLGVGYNTKLIKKDELPKTYQDLLDPKWKGKLTITGDSSGVQWMGAMLEAYGEEFIRKMAAQNFDLHMISGRALLDMIIAGEYPFSPTIFDSHVGASKKKGAPIDWAPLEPVACNLGQIMLPKYSVRPHAALLYIDFDLSKEAGDIYRDQGYNSPRKDIIVERPYKKYYGFKSTADVAKWNRIFSKVFLKK